MTELVLDKTDYDVLNVVAIKKMASAATVARDSGAQDVPARLESLAGHGLLVTMGDVSLPTDDTALRLAEAAAEHYAAVRDDASIAALVDRFETVNSQFLTTMSAWQQIDLGGRKVANDHTDAEYDGRIIDRLDKLVHRLTELLGALADHDPRFSIYQRRFDAALEAVDGGNQDMVSSPMADSIHTVWFEFHEDLLRTLGKERPE